MSKARHRDGAANLRNKSTWMDEFPLRVPRGIAQNERLTMTAKMVFACILDHAGKEGGGRVYPGIRRIAAEIGCGHTAVEAGLGALREDGLLRWETRQGRSNEYVLLGGPTRIPGQSPTRKTGDTDPDSGDHPPGFRGTTHPDSGSESYNGNPARKSVKEPAMRRGGLDLPPVPRDLDVPTFVSAWDEWKKHRTELRKQLTPTAAGRLLRKLEGLGVARAVSAIEHSIANGWMGVYEPNGGGKPVGGRSALNGRQFEGAGDGDKYADRD